MVSVQVIAVAKSSDLVLMVLDASKVASLRIRCFLLSSEFPNFMHMAFVFLSVALQ